MTEIELWFNPNCSKCRATRERLVDAGAPHRLVHYLDDPRSREELEAVLRKLGESDPRTIARSGGDLWQEQGLDEADDSAILEALVRHPQLVQRPIGIRGERAVVARPPDRIDALIDTSDG